LIVGGFGVDRGLIILENNEIVTDEMMESVNQLIQLVVMTCAEMGMYEEFCRLKGFDIHPKRTPIDRMIDDACGYEEESYREFIKFVIDDVIPTIDIEDILWDKREGQG
jgi:hypothetical protein